MARYEPLLYVSKDLDHILARDIEDGKMTDDIAREEQDKVDQTVDLTARSKPKKKRVHSLDKRFLTIEKLLFSSLSMRACAYAYFNIIPNGCILSNSTKPPTAGQPISYHDRLIEYSVSDLTLHFIEIKDPDFLPRFKKICGIPDKGIWCAHVGNITRQMSQTHLDNLVLTPYYGGAKLLSPRGVADNQLDSSYLGVFPVKVYHVCRNLLEWWKGMQFTATEEFAATTPHAIMPIDITTPIVDRGYHLNFDLDILKRQDGTPVFRNKVNHMRFEAIDGIDGVSFKEFLKRVSTDPFTFDLMVWSISDTYVLHMTIFENDLVKVKTLRPNVVLIPLDAGTPTTNRDLLNFSEKLNDA